MVAACAGGESGFEVGTLRWEATVRDLEAKLANALSTNPMATELSDTVHQCVSLLGRVQVSSAADRKLVNRAAAILNRLVAKLNYKP